VEWAAEPDREMGPIPVRWTVRDGGLFALTLCSFDWQNGVRWHEPELGWFVIEGFREGVERGMADLAAATSIDAATAAERISAHMKESTDMDASKDAATPAASFEDEQLETHRLAQLPPDALAEQIDGLTIETLHAIISRAERVQTEHAGRASAAGSVAYAVRSRMAEAARFSTLPQEIAEADPRR
jgi:hypothetical protein